MSRLDRITSDPSICHGKPTVRRLRYPVENLLELLASGVTIEDVIADHPDLERDDPARRPRVRRPCHRDAASGATRHCVKFLVDAQLPVRLARSLATAGYDAAHTSELHEANRTTDGEIARLADAEDRGTPGRLLVVATGNIANDDLIALFDRHLDAVVAALEEARFVELAHDRLVPRRPLTVGRCDGVGPRRRGGRRRPLGCGPARRRPRRQPDHLAHEIEPTPRHRQDRRGDAGQCPPDPEMPREDLARSGTDLARRSHPSVRR